MVQLKTAERRKPVLDLIGGDVCLDFINTLDDRPRERPTELLNSYYDLVRFGGQTGILTAAQAEHLFQKASDRPEEAARALGHAHKLREAIYQIFEALMNKRPAPQAAMNALNANLRDSAMHLQLVQSRERCAWRFDDPASFHAVLWPIARAAASLLASDRLALVRTCLSPTCQWYFLDTSKNHRRRWCDMAKCGNRAKARSFYRRKRSQHEDSE